MQLPDALIAAVSQQLKALVQLQAAAFVKGKIMSRAATMRRADDLSGAPIDDHLAFQGVSLLLATVVGFLLFFGRSIGVSATSTTMSSISWSANCNFFLPGRVNALLLVKISSTRRMVRQTLDSWMPQLRAMWKKVRYSRQYSRVIKT